MGALRTPRAFPESLSPKMCLPGTSRPPTTIVDGVNDPTPLGTSGAGGERMPNSPGTPAGTLVNRDVIRRLLATAASNDDPTLRSLIEELVGENRTVESLVDGALADPNRLAVVEATGLLNSPGNAALDRLVALTAEAIGTPSAAVTVISHEKQVLAGCTDVSVGVTRTAPLEDSICKFAVASGQPLIVDDTTTHPLLADHPKVVDGTVRAYAGILLADADGYAIGTLCTWDVRPRRWTSGQVQILNDLAEVARAKVFAQQQEQPQQRSGSRLPFRRQRRS